MFRYMEPSPHQGNQMPHYPGYEQYQKKIDPSEHPVMFEPWSNNYGHPNHGYCNHNSFQDYCGYRPPYPPHFAPSPAFYNWGSYPAFHEAVPYYVPPPPYAMEWPRYEYYKNVPRSYCHCCGYPNHPFHGKNGQSFKVEEEQDAETGRNGGCEVVPAQPQKLTYPIVWIPPEYRRHEGERKPSESEMRDGNNSVAKASVPKQQNVTNGWLPINADELRSLIKGVGEQKAQNHHNEDQRESFPFPIIWMPSYDKQSSAANQENQKGSVASGNTVPAANFEALPLKSGANDGVTKNSESSGQTFLSKDIQKTGESKDNKKCIPVKDGHSEKDSLNEKESGSYKDKRRTSDEIAASELSTTVAKRQSSSPKKSSKLPPVCLRVDPLPKKKNGGSRSPSPPKASSEEDSKTPPPPPVTRVTGEVRTPKDGSCVDNSEPREEVVTNNKVSEERVEKDKPGKRVGDQKEASKENLTDGGHDQKMGESKLVRENSPEPGARVEAVRESDNSNTASCECKALTRKLSDSEAATLIQSAYRGYEVRRSEPLKKLRQIANIREQVLEVSNRIQALESSSDFRADQRQKVIVGEMIMSLLLNLDTIQGLNPSLRDARKSLARELVTLQERLDSIYEGQRNSVEATYPLGLAGDQPKEEASADNLHSTKNSVVENGLERGHEKGEGEQNFSSGTNLPDNNNKNLPESMFTEQVASESCLNQTDPIEDPKDEVCKASDQQLASADVQDSNKLPYEESKVPNKSDMDSDGQGKEPFNSVSDDLVPVYHHIEEQDEVELQDPLGNSTLPVEEEVKLMRVLPTGLLDDEPPFCDDDNLCQHEISDLMPQKEEEIKLVNELFAGVQNEEPVICKHQNSEETQTGDALVFASKEAEEGKAEEGKTTVVEAASETLGGELVVPTEGAEIECPLEMQVDAELPSMSEVKVEQPQESGVGREAVEINDSIHEPPSSGSEKGSAVTEEKALLEEKDGGNEEQLQERAKARDELSHNEPAHETKNTGVLPNEMVKEQSSMQIDDGSDEKLIEENRRLREMMEKLMVAGKEQLDTISNLTGRVKDLEKKLSKRNNLKKPRRRRAPMAPRHNTKLMSSDAAI